MDGRRKLNLEYNSYMEFIDKKIDESFEENDDRKISDFRIGGCDD